MLKPLTFSRHPMLQEPPYVDPSKSYALSFGFLEIPLFVVMITNRVAGETQKTRFVCVAILHGLGAAFLPAEMGQAPSGMREDFFVCFSPLLDKNRQVRAL